jgi:hypothetical protein
VAAAAASKGGKETFSCLLYFNFWDCMLLKKDAFSKVQY